MSPGDMEGGLGGSLMTLCSCKATQAVLSTRLPKYAGLCLPSHAKPSSFPLYSWDLTGMGKRVPSLLGSRVHEGVGRDGAQVFPLAPLVF